MEPGNSSMEQSVSSELEDMRHELCDFIRSSVHQAVSSSLQKLSKNLENNLSNLISKSAQTAGECSTRPPAKPDMGTHMESESFSRMPEDAVPHKAPAKEYNNMAPKSSLKRKSKERNVLPVISPVIQDTDEDMPDVDSDSYLSDKDDDESFSIPPKKPKITSATPSLFDSEGFPMFDPSQIHHPNSTEWFPADHVGRYVAQKLFSPLDKQTRSKLKSECPRPVLSNKATITPTIDEQMLTFFTKQGKDPRKGVDKAWSSCQDKLLDITGPLTRIFDLVESARLDGSFLDPEELSLWIQRCFCLLGNANSSFIHERRKGLLIKLDPKLVKLATVQPQFQSDGQLFGDSFIKDLGKYVATFTSLTKAQQSMRKMFHQRVFARAGRGRGRFTGRGFTNQGSRGYYSSYQQDFRPQFYPQRGRGYRARSTRHSRATNPTDSDLSMRTLSTPSPALICPQNVQSFQNGRDSSTSSSSVTGETVAIVHSPPPTRLTHPLIRLASKHQKDRGNIDRLPDQCMIQIFSYLPTNQLCRCARVCRRWYNLAWDPRLWRTIRLTGETISVDRALKVLTRRLCQDTPNVCLMLETVIVSGCRRLTDRGLYIIAQCCPELRRLEVSGCYNISNEAVFDVVSLCPNMEHLDVSGCSKVTCISLTREASIKLSPIHGKQISIRYLDMTDCFVLEDEGLHTIAAHCTQLTHLYLRRCVRITDEGLRYIMIYCTSIKELSVSDCRFVSDFGLREIAKLESRLRYLSIAHCGRITDVGIRYIAKYCGKLRYLNARGCEGITDHGLEYLAKNCSKLKSLDIGKCPLVSDTGLECLALNCFNLKRLSLKSCESITGQGLQIVAANCFDLQMLNVQDCEVSVDALRFVKRHCKRCIIEHSNPAFF